MDHAIIIGIVAEGLCQNGDIERAEFGMGAVRSAQTIAFIRIRLLQSAIRLRKRACEPL